MISCTRLAVLVLTAAALTNAACAKKSSTPNASDAASSAPFTVDDIKGKSYESGCTVGNEGLMNSSYYILSMAFLANGTSVNFHQQWFSTAGCSPVNATVSYSSSGTYTLSSSGSPQSLTFQITSSDMMAHSTATQTATNTDCGGTSPYTGGVSSGNNGAHHSTYMMSCQSITFPNSANKTVNNVAALSGSTLFIGAGYAGIPGVFSNGTTPTSATIALIKQ